MALTLAATSAVGEAAGAATGPVSQLEITVQESALFDLLRAVTPYTVTVGSGLTAVDLILSDPADLVLSKGRAHFRILVRGATIPIEQVLEPELTVEYDARQRQYMVVVSRFALQVPLLGTIDIRDAFPPLAVPALIEQLWRLDSRPIGTRFHIRRLAILDHRLELEADVEFPPVGRP